MVLLVAFLEIASRDLRRSSSRRLATDFSRPSRLELPNAGAARVMTVAKVAIATKAARILFGSVRVWAMFMRAPSELEVDHLAHHEDAHAHHQTAGQQHQVAAGVGEHH